MPRRKRRTYKINPILVLVLSFITSGLILFSSSKNNSIKNMYDDILATNTVRGTVFANIVDEIINKDETNIDINKKFTELVRQIKRKKGKYGIYIKDINTNTEYVYNEKEVFYAASLFKTPIAAATLKQIEDGIITADSEITFQGQDRIIGTGTIVESPNGTKYKISELVTLLMKESDNAAQHMLERTVGLTDIKVAFEKLTGVKDTQYFHINESYPKEVGISLEMLKESKYLNETNKKFLLKIMSVTSFDDRISEHLREDLIFSHKIGSWGETGSWHDCGLVYNKEESIDLVVCMMSKNTTYNDMLETGKDIATFINYLE